MWEALTSTARLDVGPEAAAGSGRAGVRGGSCGVLSLNSCPPSPEGSYGLSASVLVRCHELPTTPTGGGGGGRQRPEGGEARGRGDTHGTARAVRSSACADPFLPMRRRNDAYGVVGALTSTARWMWSSWVGSGGSRQWPCRGEESQQWLPLVQFMLAESRGVMRTQRECTGGVPTGIRHSDWWRWGRPAEA